jgi:hypothetical protein
VVAVESALGGGVLSIVPFLTGSARAQAGDGGSPTVDGGILALGLLLVATLGTTFYSAHRVSSLLTHRAEISGNPGRHQEGTQATGDTFLTNSDISHADRMS